jgi:hypothetical protein
MDNESDWVADVRRWCLAGAQAKLAASAPTGESDSSELGYEAAYPTLQSRHWPDAPGGTRTDLR